MKIKEVTTVDIANMRSSEGLVLQGCGGDLREWVDGINKLLIDADIIKSNQKLDNILSFKYNDLTCIVFLFEGIELDMSKLAIWRLTTRETFGSMWLSDFIDNYLGKVTKKPDCPLIGADGNIFNLIGIASETLKKHGQNSQATAMRKRVLSSNSYDEALCIIGEYVNFVSIDDADDE